jgi:hypothetical protein
MRRTIAAILFLSSAMFSGAEAQAIGDWVMGTDAPHFDEARVYSVATTKGSREGTELEINRCDAYEVTFLLKEDPLFGAGQIPNIRFGDDSPAMGETKMAFASYESRRESPYIKPVLLESGEDQWYLSLEVIVATRAAAVRICPTSDFASGRCLRFSLIGFSEALRRVCASQRPVWSRH